ncbi:MAG: glycosyltransferase family 9 protein [Pseudomonadota bacterium]
MSRRRTPPNNPGAAAERVLIIKLSALGDFMLAQGAIEAVRAHHPRARITLLTTPPFEAFAKACPFIDIVETDGRPDSVKETAGLIGRIRKAKYDIIYDLQTSGRTANYFKALNLPGRKTPLWSGHAEGCAFPHNNPDRAAMHSIDRLAEQLTQAGVGPPGKRLGDDWPLPRFDWIDDALGRPPRLSPAYFGLNPPYALIIPGASEHREGKRWSAEHFAEIATRFIEEGVTPAVMGGKAEGAIAQAIVKSAPGTVNLVTRTDFFQISTLARQALIAIGNDTGPMHLATLSGAPGVALFATDESDPGQAAPRGRHVVVVHAPRLSEVSPDDVWQMVNAMGVLPKPQLA